MYGGVPKAQLQCSICRRLSPARPHAKTTLTRQSVTYETVQANLKTSEIKQHLLDRGFGEFPRWAVGTKQDCAPSNVSTSNDENGPKTLVRQNPRRKRRHPLHVQREGEASQEAPSHQRCMLAQTPALGGRIAARTAENLTTETAGENILSFSDVWQRVGQSLHVLSEGS
jgi:hypothetical protein